MLQPTIHTNSFFGYNYSEGHSKFVGKGESPFSITVRPDIARFVARVLTTAGPADILAWAKISIEGDRMSPLQVAALAEKKLGKPIKIKYIALEVNPVDIGTFMNVVTDQGRALVGTEEEVKAAIAKYFPDWNPTKYEEFISV